MSRLHTVRLIVLSAAASTALWSWHASADEPPRVSGLSIVLDYASTGSTLGVPLVYGLGTSAVNVVLTSSAVPPQATPLRDQVLVLEGVPPQVYAQLQLHGQQGIAMARTLIAPLAAYNAQLNTGIQSVADGSRAAATQLHPFIQPADVTVMQFATFMEGLEQK
jgi:hypothetical protein